MTLSNRADAVCNFFNSSGFVVVLDMKNCTWDTLPPMALISEIVSILKWIYPSRLDTIFVVNSGWVFSLIWNVVKPLLSKNTLSKVNFLGKDNAQSVLVEEIGEEHLEREYGGKIS